MEEILMSASSLKKSRFTAPLALLPAALIVLLALLSACNKKPQEPDTCPPLPPGTWADPYYYDTEKKASVDKKLGSASVKTELDIDGLIIEAVEKYGRFFDEHITPEALRTAMYIYLSWVKLDGETKNNIAGVTEESLYLEKANELLLEEGLEPLDPGDPMQNIAALALMASAVYEKNFKFFNNNVMDISVAFSRAWYDGEIDTIKASAIESFYYVR